MEFIPLDKSWLMRMGFLDIVNGHNTIVKFLGSEENLGDDLIALKRVAEAWNSKCPMLDVGESATLFRFIQFALWKLNDGRMKIIKRGSLCDRDISDSKEIPYLPLEKLLTLDNGTSQWASASVLMGNCEKLDDAPYKLTLTYDALRHWEISRARDITWQPRPDITIAKQARAYVGYLRTGEMSFEAVHSEDYCFARAFGLITPEEGEKRWPSLRGHESDRIDEMETALKLDVVESKDHRVVQAMVMKNKNNIGVLHDHAVKKSWPQFWKFIYQQ